MLCGRRVRHRRRGSYPACCNDRTSLFTRETRPRQRCPESTATRTEVGRIPIARLSIAAAPTRLDPAAGWSARSDSSWEFGQRLDPAAGTRRRVGNVEQHGHPGEIPTVPMRSIKPCSPNSSSVASYVACATPLLLVSSVTKSRTTAWAPGSDAGRRPSRTASMLSSSIPAWRASGTCTAHSNCCDHDRDTSSVANSVIRGASALSKRR